MNDLAKIEDISPGGPDDFNCCWASLLRAAARIRRLHTGAVKDKAQAQSDVVTIINDIQQAMNIWPSPEAVALMACFIDKDKSGSAHAYVASLREAVKRQPKREFPLDDGTLLVDIDAAVCKCLVRLVPEIEKELKAMQKREIAEIMNPATNDPAAKLREAAKREAKSLNAMDGFDADAECSKTCGEFAAAAERRHFTACRHVGLPAHVAESHVAPTGSRQ